MNEKIVFDYLCNVIHIFLINRLTANERHLNSYFLEQLLLLLILELTEGCWFSDFYDKMNLPVT